MKCETIVLQDGAVVDPKIQVGNNIFKLKFGFKNLHWRIVDSFNHKYFSRNNKINLILKTSQWIYEWI